MTMVPLHRSVVGGGNARAAAAKRSAKVVGPGARLAATSNTGIRNRQERRAVGVQAAEKELLMWEALREATDEEMERDPTVLVMGEDVGHYGGSYKVTYDLYKKYGEMRLLDTPIAENSFAGMGIGAAMTGLRPIIEGMNMGFLLLAFNQISNNCGMLHYTSGGQYKVPVVIRGPGGVGRQLGAEHSQRLESYFQSIPGVQLVACSTARNSKALLKAAIRSDNPVIFFEHVLLYNVKGEVGGKDEVQELNRAELVREGSVSAFLTRLCFLFAIDVYKSAETHTFFSFSSSPSSSHCRTSPFCAIAE